MRSISFVWLLFGCVAVAGFGANAAQVANGPWLDPANAEKYVFIGRDVWEVATGKVVAPGGAPLVYPDSRPVANVSDRLWMRALDRGLPGMPGEGLLYSTTDEYQSVHPTLNAEKWSNMADFPGFWIASDLRRAVWIEKGDFWRGRVDWTKGDVVDRKQVTKLGVFAGKSPVLWSGEVLFVNGGFDAAKPIVRIDLASGATEEIETYHVLNAPPLPYADAATIAGMVSPSAAYLINPTAEFIYTFDGRAGKPGAVRNVLFNNTAVSSIPDVLGGGPPPVWLGDDTVVFVNAQTVVTKLDLKKQQMTVLYSPDTAARRSEGFRFKNVLPGGRYMDIVKTIPGGQGEQPIFKERFLIDLASGQQTTTTLDGEADNGMWLDDSKFVYVRKTGGLSGVGTWLYDRQSNAAKRIAPAQLETTRMLLLRGGKEIWAVGSAGGSTLTRAKVDGSGAEEIGTSQMFQPIQFPSGPPVDLGLAAAPAPVAQAPPPPTPPVAVAPVKPTAPSAPPAPIAPVVPAAVSAPQTLYALCWGGVTGPSHTAYFSAPFEVRAMNQAGWSSAYKSYLHDKYDFGGMVRCATARSLADARQRVDQMRARWTIVETGWKSE